jgi:tellurite resistance protein TehA-like permease
VEQNEKPRGLITAAIEDLFPGYFALVMATGIVSIAAYLLGMRSVAIGLLALNVASYAVLWILLLVRIVKFFPRFKQDVTDHIRGPGFFTVAAGTCVLGSQLVIVVAAFEIAAILWFAGIALWAVTMYTFFASVTTREHKPPLEKGLSGTWLIAAVATQSVSVLGTLLAGHLPDHQIVILFFTLCMFLVGCMLYLMLIILIFYRFTFLDITSERLTPPYWINMGAVAITTLAGARLILAAGELPLLSDTLPFLKGFTLFFWSAGSWWIPLLFILGIWRHIYKRYPLRYDPQYWGLVFPLGMYTVCTFQLSKALDFEPLMLIPRVFIYFAFAAWAAAFCGLAYTLVAGRKKAGQ